MQTIIVPTDFSIKSFSALTLAKRLAQKVNGNIHLIHVIESVESQYQSMGESIDDIFDDVFTSKLAKKMGKEIMMLEKAHRSNEFTISTEVLVGNPYKKLQDKIIEYKADMIIMGEKGVTDADEFFLGSLTDKMVRNSSCPVITTKAVVDDTAYRNIVYATDLEELHEPMTAVLKAFEMHFGSTIHIVRINTRKDFKNDIDVQVSLEKLADRYDLKNYSLNTYNHEEEEDGIVLFADEKKADLIAIGIHGRSRLRRMINGGPIAEEVKDHTFRPVMTFRFNPNNT